MKEFKDKVAVITGAASGIGFGLAEHAAKEGMKVVLADIEEDILHRAEKDIKAIGVPTLAVRTDVSKADDVASLAKKTMDTFGVVHLLFNNAGVQTGKGKMVWENSLSDWQWVLGVNLWGVIHGVKVFLPIMLRQKEEGHVVNTASVAGLIAGGAIVTYKVSKAAIIALSENLYSQLKEINAPIGVTVICPGEVRSRLNDAERNRPVELSNPPEQPLNPKQRSIISMFEKLNEQGMAPEDFAILVFDSIRNDNLYLLSHPSYNSVIQERLNNILHAYR